MSLSTKYDPSGIEEHWYKEWLDNKLFHSEPDGREPYTIVIPPPNVTGILHMGHMLNNTIQDILIRKARMEGKNACWVPGTDHASIATEAKVVAMLKEKGIDKQSHGRENFLKDAYEWKDKYGGIIFQQLQKLGCSCDWDRSRFTMEPALSDAVFEVFNDLYEEGYIYHGTRMINWDPVGLTALSDEEVNHVEQEAILYYLNYALEDGSGHIQIATTRPETILGDTAVCVHPEDPRYKDFIGKKCIVPVSNRAVPIIADDYVDMEFGTGALKITPAHDENDHEIGKRHQLETIDIFNANGTINEAAGHYIGKDRFVVRDEIAEELKSLGALVKTETLQNKIGLSERTKAVVEPRLSAQWFVDMKKFVADYPQVLDSVMSDEVQFYPAKFKNTYKYWIENIKDWCISRQLWWGHRIPAWYMPDGTEIIAKNSTEALEKARIKSPGITAEELKQDEDVLDTWFSSWLWPISVFDGFKEEGQKELSYYYPTSDLVTGPDIIFFWVARMIMAGYKYQGKKPFDRVYFTGIVRDKQRRKMSKQLGNSPDPMELMKTYGTDGVRMGLMLSAPAGNDLLFDEGLCEQGRNFCNKLWNSYRLIQGWETTNENIEFYSNNSDLIHTWMEFRLNECKKSLKKQFSEFRISDAIMDLYKLTKDDFSGWYLEMIKPAYETPIPEADLKRVKGFFEEILSLLHPFMPFITEHLWQNMEDRNGAYINQTSWPEIKEAKETISIQVFDLISAIRAKRNENQLSPKMEAAISVQTQDQNKYKIAEQIIAKLANIESLSFGEGEGFKVLVGTDEVYIHFDQVEETVDLDKIQSEIKRLEGFLFSIEKKLQNDKFMANAKSEVIDREKQKKADTESKLNTLRAQYSQHS
ncbi:valine--tRNA ligase [bacterium]|nr:valine--tRNA ligase [bacterium]